MRLDTRNPQYVKIDFESDSQAYAVQFYTPGVADHTYLVVSDGEAALIDPQRDYRRFLAVADELGVTLSAVFETHIHNDYVSGGLLAARERNAKYVLPVDTGAQMEHTALTDGEAIRVGECEVTAMHTPGHTPHHTSYVLSCGEQKLAIFSGGSMLIAGVGRSDLLGAHLAESLAHDQYRSVNRIADELPEQAAVGPTHGAGSFCGSAQTNETVTSIELERGRNSALLANDEDQFVRELLMGYKLYPDYYAHMAPINLVGGADDHEMPRSVDPEELERLSHEHLIVDVRNSRDFAAGHIPGAINIPSAGSVAVYAGWALPWEQRLVLVASSEASARMAWEGFYRIGMDRVEAVVTDGLYQWRHQGRTLVSYDVVSFDDLETANPSVLIDARDPKEFSEFHVKGSLNLHFSKAFGNVREVPPGKAWVHCESGFRAAIVASILHASGRDVVLIDDHITHARDLTAVV